MWIAFLDHLAYNLDSFWHRVSAFAKVVFLILVIASVVTATNIFFIGALFVLIMAFITLSNLPVLRLSILLLYPFFFGLIFAVSRIGEAAAFPLVTLLRSVTAASAILLVLSTTRYTDFFAVLQYGLPMGLADMMFITYRSFFIILDSFSNTIKIARLRGAYRFIGFLTNLSLAGRVLGHSLIDAYEANETTQLALNIRGYEGRIAGTKELAKPKARDILVVMLGLAILVLAAVFR